MNIKCKFAKIQDLQKFHPAKFEASMVVIALLSCLFFYRILKFLFDNNINVDAVDINGYSPLDLAVRGKHRQCENFLKSVSQPHINGKVRVRMLFVCICVIYTAYHNWTLE